MVLYGLVLVHMVYGLPITTLIFRNYYSEVPTELIKIVQINGAERVTISKCIFYIELKNIIEIT